MTLLIPKWPTTPVTNFEKLVTPGSSIAIPLDSKNELFLLNIGTDETNSSNINANSTRSNKRYARSQFARCALKNIYAVPATFITKVAMVFTLYHVLFPKSSQTRLYDRGVAWIKDCARIPILFFAWPLIIATELFAAIYPFAAIRNAAAALENTLLENKDYDKLRALTLDEVKTFAKENNIPDTPKEPEKPPKPPLSKAESEPSASPLLSNTNTLKTPPKNPIRETSASPISSPPAKLPSSSETPSNHSPSSTSTTAEPSVLSEKTMSTPNKKIDPNNTKDPVLDASPSRDNIPPPPPTPSPVAQLIRAFNKAPCSPKSTPTKSPLFSDPATSTKDKEIAATDTILDLLPISDDIPPPPPMSPPSKSRSTSNSIPLSNKSSTIRATQQPSLIVDLSTLQEKLKRLRKVESGPLSTPKSEGNENRPGTGHSPSSTSTTPEPSVPFEKTMSTPNKKTGANSTKDPIPPKSDITNASDSPISSPPAKLPSSSETPSNHPPSSTSKPSVLSEKTMSTPNKKIDSNNTKDPVSDASPSRDNIPPPPPMSPPSKPRSTSNSIPLSNKSSTIRATQQPSLTVDPNLLQATKSGLKKPKPAPPTSKSTQEHLRENILKRRPSITSSPPSPPA